MKIYKITITLILCLFTMLDIYGAHSDYIGTPTSKLLEINVDPRVNALGGTYCGYVSDLVGYEDNIAGIAELKQKQFIFAYYDWLWDTSIQYIALGIPIKKIGVIATSTKYLSVPDFANKNEWGAVAGLINIHNFILTAGVARKYRPNIKYGINLKYNYQNYSANGTDVSTLSSFAIDLAVQYRWDVIKLDNIPLLKRKKLYIKNLQVGLTLQNFGLATSPDSLPRKIKIGASYPFTERFVFLLDINKNLYNFASIIDSDYRFNIGLEYNYRQMFYIRGGIKLGYDMNSFTAGMGFQTTLGSFLSMFNYGLGGHETLGHLNNFSLSTKFERFSFSTPFPTYKLKLIEYHYYRGISLFVKDKIKQAIAEWKEVLKIDPSNSDALERIKEAEKILEQQRKIKEGIIESRVNINEDAR